MNGARYLSAALIAVSLVSCAPRARAQEFPASADSLRGMKSGSTAFLLSFLGTAVPIGSAVLAASRAQDGSAGALILGGYMLGPSLGHFYAGRPGRAFAGIGIRTIALIGLGAAIVATWNNDNSAGDALGGASVALGTIFALADIVDASRSARLHNEKVPRNRLTITPAAIGSMRAPGLRVDCGF